MTAKIYDNRDHSIRIRRFWIWYKNSPVRVALKPGQTLHLWEGGRTDEGFSNQETTFFLNVARRTVEMGIGWRARDCDGLHTGGSDHECRWCDLEAREPREENKHWVPRMPLWKKLGSSERDHAAEAAGY